MTIKEKGYSHWEGELAEKKFPWWPITRLGIRSTFRKKFFKIFFFGSLMPALVFLVGIYISERLEDFRFMIQRPGDFLTVDPGYFKSYFTGDFLLFLMVMILVFCGAGLICDDLKHNSLQLYFSRPLKISLKPRCAPAILCLFPNSIDCCQPGWRSVITEPYTARPNNHPSSAIKKG